MPRTRRASPPGSWPIASRPSCASRPAPASRSGRNGCQGGRLPPRPAAAFGARAIAPTARHSPQATGALAKAASGALEIVPLVAVTNLARGLAALKARGFLIVGLDGEAELDLAASELAAPLALVLG